jgi:hypothetical protein
LSLRPLNFYAAELVAAQAGTGIHAKIRTNNQQSTAPPPLLPRISIISSTSSFLLLFLVLVSNIESVISDSTHSKLSIMASLLITRGLHFLIASRDSTPNEIAAWNAITRRDSEKQEVLSKVLLLVWVLANIVLFVPVLFIVSNPQTTTHVSNIDHVD